MAIQSQILFPKKKHGQFLCSIMFPNVVYCSTCRRQSCKELVKLFLNDRQHSGAERMRTHTHISAAATTAVIHHGAEFKRLPPGVRWHTHYNSI